ncbi:mannan endo-1,6-alpha-mannosidase [Ascodesmis nigricans]|uniref:Mannan endo-1,6-alpha-mannosidase n=1 Tax=Ascodesmis nigricans TaxID=341454 RepID=A0A4S2N8B8_9PEZI|nr:mannan endo-1,6-alpha-mannosidase [Ascodesmis nigricans]
MKLSHFSAALSLLASTALAIDINVDDPASIKNAAGIAAKKLRALYPTDEPWFIPGEFGLIQTEDGKNNKGYYWWEAGAAMGGWIDYWAYTGDDTYNDRVMEAMLFQVGEKQDYQPRNQSLALGNDDQGFWGIAAITAAERGFPDPPEDKPQWLALGQAVFNRQAGRWDAAACNGGLRWQVFQSNKGYDYKNTISNGLFFNMGARLGRYTDNATYIEWAEKTWKWSREMNLVDKDYAIYDGSHIPECTVSSSIRWSYNAGVYLAGAAAVYDYYKAQKNEAKMAEWEEHTMGLLKATDTIFFNQNSEYPANVMQESACENPPNNQEPTCNTDQRSFKAYLSRFMGQTYQLCDFTRDFIMERLKTSAEWAAKSCNGPPDGNTCGLRWGFGKYDGSPYGIAKGGVGEHMAAMEVFHNLLAPGAKAPLTDKTGGTSKGDAAAGSGGGLSEEDLRQTDPSSGGDRAGAGILTTLTLGGLLGLTFWLIKE